MSSPLVAYYFLVANEAAHDASLRERRHASRTPKPSGKARINHAVAALIRPIRGLAASAG